MNVTAGAPLEQIESVTMRWLPEQTGRRLSESMERNNNDRVTDQEQSELIP